eukprot:scaffold314789_cov16-Prasinocladus_malaysianus.AAC.1
MSLASLAHFVAFVPSLAVVRQDIRTLCLFAICSGGQSGVHSLTFYNNKNRTWNCQSRAGTAGCLTSKQSNYQPSLSSFAPPRL